MSDARLLLEVEAQKKSGWIAALMNIFIPGLGYAYCKRWIIAILAFLLVVFASIATVGVAYPPFAFILFIDGFLCASRYNKKVIASVLASSEKSNTP